MKQTLTGPEIQREGLVALRERLGIRGMVQFLHDMGMTSGDYTADRRKFYDDMTIDEFLADMEEFRKEHPELYPPQPPKHA